MDSKWLPLATASILGQAPRALLKFGDHLVIDQTGAMTTIDMNTGAYVGHRTQEQFDVVLL